MRLIRGRPDLSIVVVTYRMNREAPRTLQSLSRRYQRDLSGLDYEVLVVDNGSPEPLPSSVLDGLTGPGANFRLHRLDPAPPSPAPAVNIGVGMTTGRTVGLVIDGARMVTPGVVGAAMRAMRLHERPIVTTMAWHLGPEHQSLSIPKGYDAEAEDALLEKISWPQDGYRLFDIASLAGANPGGFLGDVNESCCLLLPRPLWQEAGGIDERFDLPGGGLVNLDLFTRLVGLPSTQLIVLLGEGSFHQVHGGASTKPGADHGPWHAQYQALRGVPYTPPAISPVYYGALPDAARPWLTGPPS
jgi:hypothetical protein